MATTIEGRQITIPAYANYSATPFIAVKMDSANAGRAKITTTNDPAIGIMQNLPAAAGQVATVMTTGISKCIYGAGVTVGDNLKCGVTGKLITADSTNPVIGVAMKTGVLDDVGEVLLDVKGPSMGTGSGAPYIGPIRIPLANLTTDAAYLTGIPVPSSGTLTGAYVLPEIVASTTGKASTITISTGAGALTGGVIALTSANCKLTAAIPATAISGANSALTSSSTLVLTTSSTTSFAGDTGYVWLYFTTTS